MSEKAKETNTKNRNKILSIVYIGVSAALIAICSWIQIPLTVPLLSPNSPDTKHTPMV